MTTQIYFLNNRKIIFQELRIGRTGERAPSVLLNTEEVTANDTDEVPLKRLMKDEKQVE